VYHKYQMLCNKCTQKRNPRLLLHPGIKLPFFVCEGATSNIFTNSWYVAQWGCCADMEPTDEKLVGVHNYNILFPTLLQPHFYNTHNQSGPCLLLLPFAVKIEKGAEKCFYFVLSVSIYGQQQSSAATIAAAV